SEAAANDPRQEIVEPKGHELDVLVLGSDATARRDPSFFRNERAKQENALARSTGRDEESRNGLDPLGGEPGFFEDLAADRLLRRLALLDHAGSHGLEPAAGLRARRIHELLDEIDGARLGIDQECRDRVTTLEIEPLHLLAHASVVALEPQPRLIDLEEIVEHAPAADDLDLRHCGSFHLGRGVYLSWSAAVWSCRKAWPQRSGRTLMLTRRRFLDGALGAGL